MALEIESLGSRVDGVQDRVVRLIDADVPAQVAAGVATLWGPEATEEASKRLGWTADPREMLGLVAELEALREDFAARGVHRVVLCGMGGSSLAPEVMAKRDGVALEILDSTHPDQVARSLKTELVDTLVVVASKSGTTVETATARASFERAFRDQGIDPIDRVIIVTDPNSPLHQESSAKGHRVFLADPNVGGRFSALTAFGLVPTTLAGVDTRAVIDEAASVWDSLRVSTPDNPAVLLAASLSGNRDIAVLLADEEMAPGLGDWIEQLVAESTGKDAKGVLPVVAEDENSPEVTGDLADVVVVDLAGKGRGDASISGPLGAQFLLWEYATAFVGYLLELNPFDQPDVESAKIAARGLLDQRPTPPAPDCSYGETKLWLNTDDASSISDDQGAWTAIAKQLDSSGYLSVQLYADRLAVTDTASLRQGLASRLGRPGTIGFGPRFLHSTGQFHKGGTPDGVFVQVEVVPHTHIDIPGYPFDFTTLVNAQSAGDRGVLIERGRPVLTVQVGSVEALQRFLEAGALTA